MKGIRTRIAGFNHHGGAPAALMGMKPDTRLFLIPEPSNPHDKNAIRVTTVAGLMLGYVPKVDNTKVLRHLDDKDVLVRCFKSPDTFNSIIIHFIEGDPLT